MSKVPVNYDQLCGLADHARRVGTLDAFADVALQWAGQADKEIERLRQWEIVGREWLDKTDWMQSKDAPVRWLGKHRADALRDEIERLTAERDDLKRAVRYEADCVEAAKAEIERLTAERDELRRQLAAKE